MESFLPLIGKAVFALYISLGLAVRVFTVLPSYTVKKVTIVPENSLIYRGIFLKI
jgi:hypothetical protein